MAVQGVGLVLSQHSNLQETGVDEVRQHEVNEAVGTTKRNGGLSAVFSQGEEALSLAAGEDNGKDVRKASHDTQSNEFFHILQGKDAGFHPRHRGRAESRLPYYCPFADLLRAQGKIRILGGYESRNFF